MGFFTLFAENLVWMEEDDSFLPALMPFIGMIIVNLIGIGCGVNLILVASSWILLGYTVLSYAESNANLPVTA